MEGEKSFILVKEMKIKVARRNRCSPIFLKKIANASRKAYACSYISDGSVDCYCLPGKLWKYLFKCKMYTYFATINSQLECSSTQIKGIVPKNYYRMLTY